MSWKLELTLQSSVVSQKISTVAWLKKRDLKRPDKQPRNYDQTPFSLDGRVYLDISFGDKTVRTPVYIKSNAPDQMLLSEVELVQYHPEMQPRTNRHPEAPDPSVSSGDPCTMPRGETRVPTVSVCLVQALCIPPNHCAVVPTALG